LWRFVFNGTMTSSSAAGRYSPLTNITNGVTVLQLTDTLNNTGGITNSTPALTIAPAGYFCQNNIDNYAPGAIDADGDSLVFSLIPGKIQAAGGCANVNTGSGTVTYASGYSAADPLHHYAGTFTFNTATGQITFTPDIVQRSMVVYNVREYRAGVLVGVSQREMNFLVQSCTTAPPAGGIISASAGTIVDSTHYQVCQNSGGFSFDAEGHSADTTLLIHMTASGLPAGSTFTVANDSTNHPVGTFSWDATTATPGTYIFYVTYKDNQCPIFGTNTQAFTVTIAPLPTSFSGTFVVCQGQTTTVSNSIAGGTWFSSDPTIATVDMISGVVTGNFTGTVTLTYTTAAGCTATHDLTVNLTPPAITGTLAICNPGTTTLSNAIPGGTWASSTFVAVVSSTTGVVTAVSPGTTTITYTLSSGCYSTAVVTVNLTPSPITGSTTVCVGSSITLNDAVVGGTWVSTNTAVAFVGATTGMVTGVSAGTTIISYFMGTGCAVATTITVNPLPTTINPATATSICLGSTVTLSDITPGGVWTSGTTSVATVGPTTGVVTAAGIGTSMITYTLASTGCYVTKPVTVNTAPVAITPASATICAGSTVTFSNTVTGGNWSSSSAAVATVGSLTGVVTGVGAGVANITYAIGTCTVMATVTVNSLPVAINPATPTTVCIGSNVTLSDATPGGGWVSSTTTVATVGSTNGVVIGVAPGTSMITYTLASTGCYVTKPVTVNLAPTAILPAGAAVCVGGTTTMTDGVTGGTWASTTAAVATVGSSSGVVAGITAGTSTIIYAIGTCTVAATVTVNPLPAAIGGPTTACVGATSTLTDVSPGGTWGSSATGVATVGLTTGLVTGVATGTTIITYTLSTGCITITTITVNPAAAAGTISGASIVCTGATSTYSSTATGGTWSVSNANATINSSGVLTGVTSGTTTISYTVTNSCGTAVATKVVTLSAAPTAGVISGPTTVCAGSNITLSSTVSGGTWASSNTTIATIGSASGVLNGASAGVVVITYTNANTCGTATATYNITVNPLGSAGTVSGPSSVCVSGLITLTSTATGGVWSATNGNATVGFTTGIVTGILPGIDTITYTVSGACGFGSATKVVTVNPLPTAGTISGPSTVCVGSLITLSSTVSGGVWSTSNSNASIVSPGVVTGVTGGGVIISYVVTTACGTATTTTTLTVIPLPNAGTLSGPDSVCIGSNITLTSTVGGGAWIAGNSNATVTGGVVTGVSAGTVPITYSVTNACGTATAVKVIEVLGPPTAGTLSGPSSVCVGSGISLTASVAGGVWSASNANVSIPAPSIVLGVTTGASTISYTVTNMCGVDVATKNINVNATPVVAPIIGATSQCAGSVMLLTNATPGGFWTSSDMTVATVDLASGLVTAAAVGVTNITYTVTNAFGCPGTATSPDTVLLAPTAGTITGTASTCVGATTTLSDVVTGGTWSSAGMAVATVDAAGVVTGVAPGTATISYSVANICGIAVTTQVVTVNALPTVAPITGIAIQCIGTTSTLTDATPGGTWQSADVTIATVAPTTGVVTGVSGGIVNILYIVTNAAGCSASAAIADVVNPLPVVSAISGPANVCIGGTATVTNATAGGTWSSSNLAVATIDPTSGIIDGLTLGTFTVSYTYTNATGCTTAVTMADTVIALPTVAPITGGTNVCVGGTATLTSATTGGTWVSSDLTKAVAGLTSGIVTGVAPGEVTIVYTYTGATGCTAFVIVIETVNALPAVAAITGTATECIGATTTLADATAGGVWSSSDATIATVGTTGIVTGVSAGTATITYAYTNSLGCTGITTIINTVNALPAVAAITGTADECLGTTTTLADVTPGGTWSSGATTIATVDVNGVVTGVAGGTATISYSVSGAFGCVGVATVVNTVSTIPAAAPITGPAGVCPGGTVTLGNAVAGGTWSSADVTVAIADAMTGAITGVATGTTIIIYTVNNACGSVADSSVITVNPLPMVGPITSVLSTVCSGGSTLLSDATAGGIWTSGTPSVATIGSSSGIVTAVTTGVTTITYTVISTAGCSAYTTYALTVGSSLPTMVVLPLGSATLCDGVPVTMFVNPVDSGLTFQWLHNGSNIAGATSSTYLADTTGAYSVIVSNGVCSQILTGTTVAAPPVATIGFNPPNILYTGTYAGYQWYLNGVAITGATTAIVTATTYGTYTVKVHDTHGCYDSSDAYIFAPSGVGTAPQIADINVYPNPAASVLHVAATGIVNIRVTTMDGKMVTEQKRAKDIDVSKLPNGLYMIMIYDENNQLLKTTKFAKAE
jgi:uncharacterized protein YjdB